MPLKAPLQLSVAAGSGPSLAAALAAEGIMCFEPHRGSIPQKGCLRFGSVAASALLQDVPGSPVNSPVDSMHIKQLIIPIILLALHGGGNKWSTLKA